MRKKIIITDNNLDLIPDYLRLNLTFFVILGINRIHKGGTTYSFSKELEKRILANAQKIK